MCSRHTPSLVRYIHGSPRPRARARFLLKDNTCIRTIRHDACPIVLRENQRLAQWTGSNLRGSLGHSITRFCEPRCAGARLQYVRSRIRGHRKEWVERASATVLGPSETQDWSACLLRDHTACPAQKLKRRLLAVTAARSITNLSAHVRRHCTAYARIREPPGAFWHPIPHHRIGPIDFLYQFIGH